MANLFTNEKETKRAIKAAEDQFRMILKKNRPTLCAVCGYAPKPDEWSTQVENCCIDCG